ncbi:MAG: hypothetical protein JOZ77_10655 [Candidatus Eremiobacteraeota bacterium]|nr:hypothetical protein [Candidatus Eremiobacteraeota bacterium]
MTRDFGRHVYGAAAVFFGLLTLYWRHDVNPWQQFQALATTPYREPINDLVATFAIAGGIAIQRQAWARLGALLLGALYLFCALSCLPGIVQAPRVYNSWGNFFEQFSMFSGAIIVYASVAAGRLTGTIATAEIGRAFFGICVLSFTLEQAFYLHATAGLVPKWIPPGQTFWAVATTIAFGLAAIAILSGRLALLASRLLTAMLLLFGILLWLPTLFVTPPNHFDWSENAENLAIAGVAWILADHLQGARRVGVRRG